MKKKIETTPFDAAEYLDDEEVIAEFVKACAEDNDPDFMVRALGTVARARGMTQLARDTGLARESLYKTFTPGCKPQFDTIARVASALGLTVSFQPKVDTAVSPVSKKVSAPSRRRQAARGKRRVAREVV